MTDHFSRPVPRWLHVWALCTVAVTFVLLAIGQFVTSFKAGMADPVWPTEPWYVFHTASEGEKERFRKDFNFFIEHSHRIAGWTAGALVSVLALGVWWTERRKGCRGPALAGVIMLLTFYGQFHGALMAQTDKPAAEVVWPVLPLGMAVAAFMVPLAVGVSGVVARAPGAWVRLLVTLALVAVMTQGLLGGFRVRLNELFGTDLAAFHGIFAQLVLALLVAVAVLTSRPIADANTAPEVRCLHRWAVAFAVLVFVQVAFGALVRHYPIPLNQRLHLATAFAATALAVWLIRALVFEPSARARVGWLAWALAILLAVQLYLGVEAWLARFGKYVLPELVPITPYGGAVRSLHALVGSALWAAALAVAIRLRPVSRPVPKLNQSEVVQATAVPVARATEGAAL